MSRRNLSLLHEVLLRCSVNPRVHLSSFLKTQVSGSTTSTVLQKLNPDTEYTVTVVPVYPEMEGISQSEKGKTSELTASDSVGHSLQCYKWLKDSKMWSFFTFPWRFRGENEPLLLLKCPFILSHVTPPPVQILWVE